MGSGASGVKPTISPTAVETFKEACAWYMSRPDIKDDEIAEFLCVGVKQLESTSKCMCVDCRGQLETSSALKKCPCSKT